MLQSDAVTREEFRKRLRVAVAKRNVSCADLATATGISRNVLYHVLSGEQPRYLEYTQVVCICATLGISIDFLSGLRKWEDSQLPYPYGWTGDIC